MQPNSPSVPPSPSAARRPGISGSVLAVVVIAVVALVYLVDHIGKSEAAVFSGVERRISAQDFHGAQCTAVFGSCKIDLRDAQMLGREAVMETYAVFGSVEILVPPDWEVVNHDFAVFSGVGDNRRHLPRGPDTKTLILEGTAVFGEVEVKN